MPAVQETIDQVRQIDVDQYKYGFETKIEMDKAPKGLSEDIIRYLVTRVEEKRSNVKPRAVQPARTFPAQRAGEEAAAAPVETPAEPVEE